MVCANNKPIASLNIEHKGCAFASASTPASALLCVHILSESSICGLEVLLICLALNVQFAYLVRDVKGNVLYSMLSRIEIETIFGTCVI